MPVVDDKPKTSCGYASCFIRLRLSASAGRARSKDHKRCGDQYKLVANSWWYTLSLVRLDVLVVCSRLFESEHTCVHTGNARIVETGPRRRGVNLSA